MSSHKDTIANYLNPNKLKITEYCGKCWTNWFFFIFYLLLPMMLCKAWKVWIWH